MERIEIGKISGHIGKKVTVCGWVSVRRDHGKLIFLDVRDESGTVQATALPEHKGAHGVAETLRSEWVIKITGTVNKRPEKMIKEGVQNGDVEIEIEKLRVLNESKTPPFDIETDTTDIDESLRLRYRYLDLRTKRLQKNIRVRSDFIKNCRKFLFENNFVEIETPLLTESTEEGSRDFVVPSRLQPGKFYALPQSPQQYKQLLMSGGFEKYFQIARAMRDEDLRSDRGFEHSQIDIEMSFITKPKEIMNLVEEMISNTVVEMGYKVKEKSFPKISYKEALEKYKDDKFDLRNEDEKKAGILSYAWVYDFPLFEKTEGGTWTFSHNPFSMPKEECVDDLIAGKNIENIVATQYDLVCNGFEIGGGSIRAHKSDILHATYKIMGHTDEQIEKNIGHMLEAFDRGTPPHGGIALGIERNIMSLVGENALRDVQAFPMTRGGQTSVMNAPNELSEKQLKEFGLSIDK